MSAAQDSLPVAPRPAPADDAGRGVWRVPVYVICTLIALIISCRLGQDVGWDTLHYHLYAGFSALHDRFAQDYFAAGPQSYFNPYVYAPFYALVRGGCSPLLVSVLLTLAQSTILWLTYELGVCACPSRERHIRLASGACAALLALLNPILICQLGSSYADITTAALVVWGWLLLAYAVRDPHPARVVAAGLILGAATALKLTNAVHALAAATLLIMLPRPLSGRLRYGLGYAASLAAGLALVGGPWAYRLAQRFGNPFFPLLNGVFRSAEFTTEPLRHYRFIPDSFLEALRRPFAIAQPDSMVHVEQMAPDVRYAALLLVLAAITVHWLWRRHRESAPGAPAKETSDLRVLMALGIGLAVDWILWLSESGNGRYFMPMASVAAVLVVALPLRQFPLRTCAIALTFIVAVQCVELYMGTDYREGALAGNHPYLRVDVPQKLATEPNLFLSMGVQSNSFILPYLPARSGFINFDGMYALGSRGANGARIADLLRRYGAHVRVLFTGTRLHADTEHRTRTRSHVDDALERLGLRVDPDDCETITVHGLAAPYEAQSKGQMHEPRPPYLQLLTCAAVPGDEALLQAHAQRQRAVDLVLDRVEDACPGLFHPRRMQTQHVGDVWMRYYATTDLVAFLNRGDVKFLRLFRGTEVSYLGRESAWAQAPVPLVCGRRDDLYFAKLPARTARLPASTPTSSPGGS